MNHIRARISTATFLGWYFGLSPAAVLIVFEWTLFLLGWIDADQFAYGGGAAIVWFVLASGAVAVWLITMLARDFLRWKAMR